MRINKASAGLFGCCLLAGMIGLSPAALATTYNIDVDACSGSGCGLSNYGTIDVTDVGGTGTDLHVVVALVSTAQFHASSAGPHPTFVFDLNHTGAVGVSIDATSNNLPLDVTPPHTSGWQFSSAGLGTYSPSGLGSFNFDIECASGEAGNVCGPKLVFDLTGTGLSLFSTLVGTKNVFFSLDVSNAAAAAVLTGNVGATACIDCAPSLATTPLPGSLPLFVSGLAAMGGLFGWRRKRKKAAAIAAA